MKTLALVLGILSTHPAQAITYDELAAQLARRQAEAAVPKPITPETETCALRVVVARFAKRHRGLTSFQPHLSSSGYSWAEFTTGDGFVCKYYNPSLYTVSCIHPQTLAQDGERYPVSELNRMFDWARVCPARY